MRLTVIGASGMVSVPDEANPGYLLTSGDDHLLVDCGPGVAAAVQRYVRPRDLTGVIVSHMHFDNFYDLLPLALALYVDARDLLAGNDRGERRTVPIYLPPGGTEQVAEIIRAVAGGREQSISYFASSLDCRDFDPIAPFSIGAFTVQPFAVEHAPGPCFGFRIADDTATVGYSGESAMCDALATIAREADLFLCDASIITDRVRSVQQTRHLSAESAGRIAQRAGAKHLALTHLIQTSDGWNDALLWAARQFYRGPVSVTRAGSLFDIPYA